MQFKIRFRLSQNDPKQTKLTQEHPKRAEKVLNWPKSFPTELNLHK